jgi:hypothetical protein
VCQHTAAGFSFSLTMGGTKGGYFFLVVFFAGAFLVPPFFGALLFLVAAFFAGAFLVAAIFYLTSFGESIKNKKPSIPLPKTRENLLFHNS